MALLSNASPLHHICATRSVVVDVQGFNTSKKVFTFTPKELAVYNGKQVAHFIFKEPFPWNNLEAEFKRQATWLASNHHCLQWEDGHTPVHLFKNISPIHEVYVKGKEKADFIRKTLSQDVIEVEEGPALPMLEASCYYHSRSLCHCALANVCHIYNTYINQ